LIRDEEVLSDVSKGPEGYHTVCPYLHIDGAAEAIEFYREIFGAVERIRMNGPDGRIGHAELELGDSVVMLADEYPELDVRGPKAIGGSPVVLAIYVDDVDDVVDRAAAAGATVTRPVEDRFYGDRVGQIEDPFGHIWSVQTHIEDVSPEEMQRRAQLEDGSS
jgi:PhnB protein